MADTAFSFIETNSTATSSFDDQKKNFIDFAVKREKRNYSDSIEAGVDSASSQKRDADTSAVVKGRSASNEEVPHIPVKRILKRPALIPLQEWEGHVVSLSNEGFTARLVDITAEQQLATEEADFAIEEVSDSDLDLLREGALFRWAIGYETAPSGSKKRVSQLVFRRLPKWTEREIKQADRRAAELVKGIAWE